MIGDKAEFFLTTFASQGQINAFIKERATSRKAILANFLDLAVFESLHELINRDAAQVKAALANIPERNWSSLKSETEEAIVESKERIKQAESEMASLQSRLAGLRLELDEANPTGAVTKHEINSKKQKLLSIQQRAANIEDKLTEKNNLLLSQQRKIEKAELIERTFPLKELEEKLKEQREIERNLLNLKHTLTTEKGLLKRLQKLKI